MVNAEYRMPNAECRKASSGAGRIERGDAEAGKVRLITRHESEPVYPRRRTEEGVHDGEGSNGTQAAPLIGDRGIDGEQSIAVPPRELEEPAVEDVRLSHIAATQLLDALPKLPDRHDAEEQRIRRLRVEPCGKPRRDARGPAEIRDDIRVEQEAHTVTGRPPSFDRWTRRCGALGMARRSALTSRVPAGPLSAASRMARCSASADRPCEAARSLSAFTSRWSRRRTSSCLMLSMIACARRS